MSEQNATPGATLVEKLALTVQEAMTAEMGARTPFVIVLWDAAGVHLSANMQPLDVVEPLQAAADVARRAAIENLISISSLVAGAKPS